METGPNRHHAGSDTGRPCLRKLGPATRCWREGSSDPESSLNVELRSGRQGVLCLGCLEPAVSVGIETIPTLPSYTVLSAPLPKGQQVGNPGGFGSKQQKSPSRTVSRRGVYCRILQGLDSFGAAREEKRGALPGNTPLICDCGAAPGGGAAARPLQSHSG